MTTQPPSRQDPATDVGPAAEIGPMTRMVREMGERNAVRRERVMRNIERLREIAEAKRQRR